MTSPCTRVGVRRRRPLGVPVSSSTLPSELRTSLNCSLGLCRAEVAAYIHHDVLELGQAIEVPPE